MSASFDPYLVEEFHGLSVEKLLSAPPDALHGLSPQDAQHLLEAFGIRTVRDLAQNRFFRRALAILAATGIPNFDPGPPPEWEEFFSAAPLDYYQEHPDHRFRLEFGPVIYRGRLDGTARVLVVGQDPATNELLGHRVFVGRSGQRVQGFLKKLGITRSYVMLNAFLYSVFGQFDSELRNISLEPTILDYRNAFLDRLLEENPIQAVVSFGNGAHHAVEHWPGTAAVPTFEAMHPAARDQSALLATWNDALDDLRPIVDPDDGAQADPQPYGTAFLGEDQVAIPRFDLPFGLPEWHGVDGGHSERQGNDRIVWKSPL